MTEDAKKAEEARELAEQARVIAEAARVERDAARGGARHRYSKVTRST
jgi:hypothetical protein